MQMFCTHHNIYVIYCVQYNNILLNIYIHCKSRTVVAYGFFSFSKFKRRLQEHQFRHMSFALLCWSIIYGALCLFCFFPGTRPWEKKRKGRPLSCAYIIGIRRACIYEQRASHDISPGGNADTSPGRICRHGGLNSHTHEVPVRGEHKRRKNR